MRSIYSEPRIGVGVVVRQPGTDLVLFGLRTGSHGAGELALPGGKLDPGEHPLDCGPREVREEAAIEVDDVQALGFWTNDLFPDAGKHFITLYVAATARSTDVQIVEPDKCLAWRWIPWSSVPELSDPLFCGVLELRARMPDLDAMQTFSDATRYVTAANLRQAHAGR